MTPHDKADAVNLALTHQFRCARCHKAEHETYESSYYEGYCQRCVSKHAGKVFDMQIQQKFERRMAELALTIAVFCLLFWAIFGLPTFGPEVFPPAKPIFHVEHVFL